MQASQLRAGLVAFDARMKGGPLEEITPELTALISVTRRPNHIDDKRAVVYFAAMQKAMMDYPLDIVHRALEDWRKTPEGQWWPAEAEVRALCEKLVATRRNLRGAAIRLLADLESEEDRMAREKARPSYFADDRMKRFRVEMEKRMSARAFDCYFHAADMKFSGDEILVRRPIAVDRLTRDGGDLLKELGLSVRYSFTAFEKEPPRVSEEATPEERSAIAEEMRALAKRMRKA